MITHEAAHAWMTKLKDAWESGNVEDALALFSSTEEYYERPFAPGTTPEEYRKYWQDIVGLTDITLDFDIVAVEGNVACVHWVNRFRSSPDETLAELDGVFVIEFDDAGRCRVFRQWWFMKP